MIARSAAGRERQIQERALARERETQAVIRRAQASLEEEEHRRRNPEAE